MVAGNFERSVGAVGAESDVLGLFAWSVQPKAFSSTSLKTICMFLSLWLSEERNDRHC